MQEINTNNVFIAKKVILGALKDKEKEGAL